MPTPDRRAVIAGVATSDYPNLPNMSEHGVHAQAAERALADAGLTFDDVDGYATVGFFPMYVVQLCEYLGLRPDWMDETHVGGASFEVLAEHAARAVEAGACDVALITYGSIQLSQMGRKLGTGGPAPPPAAAAHAMTHSMNISTSRDLTVSPAAQSGPLAFERAGIMPADVDVLQVYDSFTITVLLSLEDLGFCKKGEGGPFVEGGTLRYDGALPTSTDGGGVSACHPGRRVTFL